MEKPIRPDFQRAHLIDIGRLNVVKAFLEGKDGLNVGSGLIRFKNQINVDISRTKSDVDVLASAGNLPFIDCAFEEITFTETLEHTPENTEVETMKEISRVMKPGARIVMSVPNNTVVSKMLDPVYWTKAHRHYNEKEIREILCETEIKPDHIFSSGTIPFGVVTLSYAINWVLGRKKADLFKKIVTNSFNKILASKAGGTLFAIAHKEFSK